MSVAVNLKITDEQADKIKASGLNRSEFIRRAIDFYDVDYHQELLRNIIDYCSSQLTNNVTVKNNKVTVKNNKVTVKNNKVFDETNIKNKVILYENKDKLYTNKENLYDNFTDDTENIDIPASNEVASILANEFGMLKRILNNPVNNESLPDYTVKTLKKNKKCPTMSSTFECIDEHNNGIISTTDKCIHCGHLYYVHK